MIGRASVICLGLMLLSACARVGPPSGGSRDETPATITFSYPGDGTLATGPIDTLSIAFSERVNRESVLKHFFTDPPNLARRVSWPADTLLHVEFWQRWRPDTTVSVYLTPGWQDQHFVAQPEWEVFHFATGDSILPGWLGGKVTFKGNASRKTHLRLVDAGGETVRELRPDARGEFIMRHLPADGREWLLWAFEDVDGDSLFDPAMDFADSLADSLVLSDDPQRRLGLLLTIIDPNEPGEVTGNFTCLDTLPGSFLISVLRDSLRLADGGRPDDDPALLPEDLQDALRAPPQDEHVLLREEGRFSIQGVAPGPIWLMVHKDLLADSLWDPATEPAWIDPGPRLLEPGAKLTLPRFTFPKPDSSDTEQGER